MEYHSDLIRKVTGLDAGAESVARNAADYGFKPNTEPEEVWEFDPVREYGVTHHA